MKTPTCFRQEEIQEEAADRGCAVTDAPPDGVADQNARGFSIYTGRDSVSDFYPDYSIYVFPWETEINVLVSPEIDCLLPPEIPGTEVSPAARVVAGGLPQCSGWVAGGNDAGADGSASSWRPAARSRRQGVGDAVAGSQQHRRRGCFGPNEQARPSTTGSY